MVGERDFASLGADEHGRTVRHLAEVRVTRRGDLVEVRVTANAFLRRMVRSIVALLLAAGRGRLAPEEVDRLLAGSGRALDGRAAPAKGLTLERIVYESAENRNESRTARLGRRSGRPTRRHDRRAGNVKTYAVKASEIERSWWVVDATDQTLGRLATRIATLLEGKHKPIYSPHLDTGDHVVVLNAAEDPRHRRQAAPEDVLPPLGLSGRPPGGDPRGAARAQAGARHRASGEGHASRRTASGEPCSRS
jgi:hypothetical protein